MRRATRGPGGFWRLLILLLLLEFGCQISSFKFFSKFSKNGSAIGSGKEKSGERSLEIDDDSELWRVQTGILLDIGPMAKVFYHFGLRIPIYSIEKLDCSKFGVKDVHKRKNYFSMDQRIPKQFRPDPDFYRKDKNVDRGHMAPAGDFTYSKEDYKTCFRYSNIFPQNSKLNRTAWATIEGIVRDLVRYQSIGTLWVYTGNGSYIEKGTNESYRKYVPFLGDDKAGLAYPDFVFKILYAQNYDKNKNKQHYVYALLLPNEAVPFKPTVMLDYKTTVAHIESITGMNFPKSLTDPKNLDLCEHFDCTNYASAKSSDDDRSESEYSDNDHSNRVNVCLQQEL